MHVEGTNGSVTIECNLVKIKHKKWSDRSKPGAHGDKSIPIQNITAVQFKEAGNWIVGYIQLSLLGGNTQLGGMGAATHDPNTILFSKKQQPQFVLLKAEIESEMLARTAPTVSSVPEVSELERLASLVERGFLTREEFQTKKQSLLGV
jgi:hypothetical protein